MIIKNLSEFKPTPQHARFMSCESFQFLAKEAHRMGNDHVLMVGMECHVKTSEIDLFMDALQELYGSTPSVFSVEYNENKRLLVVGWTEVKGATRYHREAELLCFSV